MIHPPIRVPFPAASIQATGDTGGVWTLMPSNPATQDPNPMQWTTWGTATTNLFAMKYEVETDIGGLTRQEKTLYPQAHVVSTWSTPKMRSDLNPKLMDAMSLWITSYKQIDDTFLEDLGFLEIFIPSLLYSLEDNQSFMEVIGATWKEYATDSSLGTEAVRLVGGDAYGTLQPTASKRLWHTQFFVMNNVGAAWEGEVRVPASMITIPQVIAKEDDLEYVYRLKRSFEVTESEQP